MYRDIWIQYRSYNLDALRFAVFCTTRVDFELPRSPLIGCMAYITPLSFPTLLSILPAEPDQRMKRKFHVVYTYIRPGRE